MCNSFRYNEAGVPHLQFRYINILHRLQELYANPVLAAYIRYPWQREFAEDDQLRDIYDGQIWKEKFIPMYGNKDYNIALSMTLGNYYLWLLFTFYYY